MGRPAATYTIEVGVGPLVPRAIVNALVDQSLPKMLEAFKKRQRAAEPPGTPSDACGGGSRDYTLTQCPERSTAS